MIPSLPFAQPTSRPSRLIRRFPPAQLGLKDAVTRVKERPGFPALEDSANFPAPEVIAADILEDLQAALAQFAEIPADLKR